jgi:hypothetical protein
MPRRPRLPGPEFGKPSETSDVCVCAAVRILSRAMTEPHVRALAGFGLSLTDFHLLVGLQSLSEVNAWHLAAMVRLDPAAVSRSLARLEERRDVERTSVRTSALATDGPWSGDRNAPRLHLGRDRRSDPRRTQSSICRGLALDRPLAAVAAQDSGTRVDR